MLMRVSAATKDDVSNNERVVLIIDTLPLRSLNLISILNRLDRLDRLAVPSTDRAASHAPDEAEQCIDAGVNEMLIYNAGSACTHDNLERIKALRALAPDVPLMIFSDNESREEIVSALNVGGDGFLYVGTKPELALQAFSSITNGGTYVPSTMRPERTFPSQRHPEVDCIPVPTLTCDKGGSIDAAQDLEEAGPIYRNLTARQKAVLELLSRGDPNKLIARQLGMREGTVKVHVRQIMRKFGVTNRTQVAVVCVK